ncbi:biotin/lipoyl-binding protein [Psychromonas sp. KJ10-10]|uniref:biotin/lipoyl-binding protein n=1 Tax=Psychromonas sp. KJ10-10 TaxID=3391823 RepID=UPI0039B40B75
MNKPAFLPSILIIFTVLTSPIVMGAENGRPARPATSIYSEVVEHHEVSQSLTLIGKLQSDKFVSIASEVTAKVTSINVKENQVVKEGQLLFKLDDRKAQVRPNRGACLFRR